MVKILYFGRLSDRTQIREESLELPPYVLTVSDLKTWLNTHHDLEGVLSDPSIKTMIDKQLVHTDASINSATEIGFLPPVGGG